ncbi:MAG: hypothetical protein Q7T77_05505 [Sulfuricurvum sp.]|nr:hypothetical protein [Sulfuricurvum sp.]
MRLFVYAIIFLFVFILFKAFYLDSLPSEPDNEVNTTVEQVVTVPDAVVHEAEHNNAKENANSSSWADKSGRPIDQLGDKIADKFKDKL